MSVLEIKNISKAFGELEVIKDISLNVEKGEVVAIIGPSGSGKSTLLRCATLLERADGGEIVYEDGGKMFWEENDKIKYASKKELKKIRTCFGLVFQNFNLFPHMTVLKNIIEAPVSTGIMKKPEAKEKAMELLKKMGLEDKAGAYPGQLSGGQQQRVSIARALILNPSVLFFDEPTSALDPELTGEILKVIKELALEHMTMVIVTHEMGFARDVADKIIFMDGGIIVEQGKAEELINNPQNERTKAFLGKFLD